MRANSSLIVPKALLVHLQFCPPELPCKEVASCLENALCPVANTWVPSAREICSVQLLTLWVPSAREIRLVHSIRDTVAQLLHALRHHGGKQLATLAC